jgi:hypothetical protein
MLHGELAVGWLAGQPSEPPADPPEPLALPPVLPPAELPPEPAVVDAAEPPAPPEPPDLLSSPPQLVRARAAQKEVVATIEIQAAVFIDILPFVRACP